MQFARKRKKSLPVFSASKKVVRRLNFSWRTYLWGVFFILLIAGLAYLLFWSPFLKIKKTSIAVNGFSGQEKVEALVSDFLRQRYWRFIPGDSFFILSTQSLKKKIEDAFLDAENVLVQKDVLNGLAVSLSPRQAAAVWCQGEKEPVLVPAEIDLNEKTGNVASSSEATSILALPEVENCFFVDRGGLAFRRAPEISGTFLSTFYDKSGGKISVGSLLASPSAIEFANLVQEKMKETGVSLQGFLISEKNSSDLAVLTGEGWSIYFDLSRPAEAPLKILETLLAGELKDKRTNLKYVDLRTLNRVYYK